MRNLRRLSNQAVGAFGERAVEAELLRHGWIPANVNATVKNAADFDIGTRCICGFEHAGLIVAPFSSAALTLANR
jgi:hypothetical protein